MASLKLILNSPWLNLLVGLVLLYSGGTEVWRDWRDATAHGIGAHHGVALYGLVHLLKCLPELFEGLAHIDKSGNIGSQAD